MDNTQNKNLEGVSKRSPFDELTREELVTKCKGLLVLAQKAKQAKSEYQIEVDNYKSQVLEFENEKKSYINSIKTLQELVDSLTEQKLNYITEIDTAQNKLKSVENKCCKYEEEINQYKADLLVRDQKLSSFVQKISDLDNETISLKRQNNRLLEENDQLINQLAELEARAVEFNNIGLQQQEQLQILEEKIQNDSTCNIEITDLQNKIRELEISLKKVTTEYCEKDTQSKNKIDELNSLYENEKLKKDKANIKLRSYKDKILKCASCINQLKNARFILTKTIKEYSENIPKWQNEIIKASKILDQQMNEINQENLSLKTRIEKLEKQLDEVNVAHNNSKTLHSEIHILENNKQIMTQEITLLQQTIKDLQDHNKKLNHEILEQTAEYKMVEKVAPNEKSNANNIITEDINTKMSEIEKLYNNISNLNILIENLKSENENLKSTIDDNTDSLLLQIKALESEKSILVKEKLNAKDNLVELETQTKILSNENDKMKADLSKVNLQLESMTKENTKLKEQVKKDEELKQLQIKNNDLQIQYDNLKKEFENIQDVNSLLREEIETLKFSLDQPKGIDTDLNVSLQADIVKLETKLAAYKQENALLLQEIKDCRVKMKECDNIVADYEDVKSKLLGYKTENNELLNEMKEINQVLKERGEAISKLQKAITEMENLIETVEKDRDEKKNELMKTINMLENNLKSAELSKNKINEDNEKLANERDNALKFLREKDLLIATLKDELEKIKQTSCNAIELPNEDNMSTSTISKAEEHSRMKDLDETFEEKYSKLRIFALKLKKKLNETTTQLQNLDQENLKLKKLIEEREKEDKSKTGSDEIDSMTKVLKEDQKAVIFDLEAKIKSLSNDLQKLQAELIQNNEQLTIEVTAHTSTKQQLEKALRDVKKKNVLSLEMEDYEKSLKELTTKMEEKKKKIVQMESTIDSQEGTITAMKTQIKLLEEQIKTEEAQNRLLKEDLQQAIQVSKDKDNVISAKKDTITKLIQDFEDEKRKNEEADLEMTSLLSEKENIIMTFSEEKIELNNKIKKLEFKCAELNEKLTITNTELADLTTEYTSYKVRAQAVLRQNQTIDHSQEEHLKEETAALKAQAESLNLKLNTLQNKYTEQSAELEATRKRAVEASAEASRAQQRTTRLQADLTRLSQQLESERTQHKLQISTLTQCYKSQIIDLETKLQKETESLRKQLATIEKNAKVSKMEEESNREKYMIPVIPRDDGSDGEMDINVSMIPREEGEGSESAPSPTLSKSFLTGDSRRSPVPLDRLLEEGVPEDETLDTSSLSLTPEQEIADLKRKVLTTQQRVKHVTLLLSESEREGARMAQLSELLKSELRRVRGATQNAHNTEYMKNVTLKFLTLPPGDERSRLVPVLQKILTLSSEESQKIQAIAKGMDPNPSKGWGSYLPWPGGK